VPPQSEWGGLNTPLAQARSLANVSNRAIIAVYAMGVKQSMSQSYLSSLISLRLSLDYGNTLLSTAISPSSSRYPQTSVEGGTYEFR